MSRLHPINHHDGEDIFIGRERVRDREVGREEIEESKKVREQERRRERV